MRRGVEWIVCLLLALGSLADAREPSAKTGQARSQMMFLQPPADFAPRFEVSGCYCLYEGKVLYLLRSPRETQGLSWCVPGGKLEKGETPAQALARELKEEVDFTVSIPDLAYRQTVYMRFPSVDFVLHMFRLNFTKTPPTIHLDLKENVDYRWVSLDEVEKLPLIQGGRECFHVACGDVLVNK